MSNNIHFLKSEDVLSQPTSQTCGRGENQLAGNSYAQRG